MRTRHFLATNDDGIDSPAFAPLVRALQQHGRVTVVAPASEQSWISKAISRRRELTVRKRGDLFDCEAWDVDGTPADCVNVALGNLVKGHVDMVVSGINMGSNVSIPLIMASGTVGAALEAACHGVHAMATSIRISRLDFEQRFQVSEEVIRSIAGSVEVAARRTAELCARIAAKRRPKRFLVHNLNFPPEVVENTAIVRTVPALLHTGTLFHPRAGTDQHEFRFAMGEETPSRLLSDRTVLEANQISHSVLDFGRLGISETAHGRVPAASSFGKGNP